MTTEAPTREWLKTAFPIKVKFSVKGVRHERNEHGELVLIPTEQKKENR